MVEPQWKWSHIPGGHQEEYVGTLPEPGRGIVVVQSNSPAAFRVVMSVDDKDSRGTGAPVLCFKVGRHQNTSSAVGMGNPFRNKEPLDSTSEADALAPTDGRLRTYWFMYDREVGIAAFGIEQPQAETVRLLIPLEGMRREVFDQIQFVRFASGKQKASVNLLNITEAIDLSVRRFQFDKFVTPVPWHGACIAFQLPEPMRKMFAEIEAEARKTACAPLHAIAKTEHLVLQVLPLLDSISKSSRYTDTTDWAYIYEEIYGRAFAVLSSAPWTFFNLSGETADSCTAYLTVSPGVEGRNAIRAWMRAMEAAVGWSSEASMKERLSITFAYPIYPIVGDRMLEARHELSRKVDSIVRSHAKTLFDLRGPELRTMVTAFESLPYASARRS
mmetsp:Transcript_3175/g.7149  ORF Transcript_3175/g.7149 Transcript_3175/m.7149 type:complete len:387 (-) Transcript_3175:100-1260(-)